MEVALSKATDPPSAAKDFKWVYIAMKPVPQLMPPKCQAMFVVGSIVTPF